MKHFTLYPISSLIRIKSIFFIAIILLFTKGVLAQNNCEANFTYSLNQTAKTVVFTNNSFGTGLIYRWTFGDNTISLASNPTKTFSSTGTYTVCLKVTKADSTCTHTRCSTIVVSIPCLSTWTVTTASGNILSKNFASNNTSLDYSYFWSFGDNTHADSRTPNHVYSHAGKYRVCLRVAKKDSTCVTETCDSITVSANTAPPCVSTWTVTTNPNTPALARYFTSTSTSNDFNYFWTFGDGFTSDSKTPNHTYSIAGKYKVCLKVSKKDSSCTSTSCDSITIVGNNNMGCNANWTLTTDGSNNLKKYFTAASTSNDFNYRWTFGDGINADSKTPNHIYSQAGKYKVCLKITKKDSSCTLTVCDSITVTASVGCEANFIFTKTGREVHFMNTSSGSYTRSIWKFGDSSGSDMNSPNHNFNHNGTFTVCLYTYRIINGDTACRSSRCKNITVSNENIGCVANFTYGVNHLLRRLEVNSTATGSNLIYKWTFGDDSVSNLLHPANHSYLHNGIYRVCLLVINALDTNCRSEICKFINVNHHDSNIINSVVQADYLYSVSNPSNNTVQFTNQSLSATTYAWNFGDGSSSSEENPIHSFENNEYHLVCLAASGPNGNDVFCSNISTDISSTRITKSETISTLNVFPNPFSNEVKIDLNLLRKGAIIAQIIDISGKIIDNQKLELSPGSHSIQFETSNLNNGIYILNIVGEGLNKNFKIIK